MNTLSSRTSRLLGIIGFTLVTAAGSGMALARDGRPAMDPPKMSVSYKDLDLSRPADARVLYARLRHAASSVCASNPAAAGNLLHHAAYDRCYSAAMADAMKQISAPQVIALYHSDAANDSRRG